MPHSFRYWAFLSYSHEDSRAALRLHRALENYVVPRRLVGLDSPFGPIPQRLWPIFRDRDELKPGGRLGSDVEHALELSRSLIVLCSPTAAASTWVEAEIAAFETQQPDAPLFCVILDGEPLAKDAADECLPPALHARYAGTPGMAQGAPIAIDLRPDGDGQRRAVQQIVAGITGLPLDQLVQRDAHRRHARMAWLSLVLLGVAISLGVLAASAYKARNEARAQRAQAEGLIEFMLVDLRKKLEPVGGLDAMGAVGSRALRYYDQQPLKSLDPESLGRRARALHLIGEIADRRGDTKDARAAFSRASTSTAELLARAPDDPERLYNHAQSVFWNGYIDWQYGDTDGAERAFIEYGRIAARLSAKDPSNPDWLAEVGYAHSNLGTLLLEQGRAAEAIKEFRQSLTINRKRATLPGDVPQVQLDIGQDHSWLSSALFANRQLRQAIVEREAELDIYVRLHKTTPEDAQVKDRSMSAHRFLGEMYLAAGELALAKGEIDSSIQLAEQLREVSPDNEAWQKSIAGAWALAAERARLAGDPEQAQQYLDAADKVVAAHLAKDPEAWAWRLDAQESVAAEQAALDLYQRQTANAEKTLLAMRARLLTAATNKQSSQHATRFGIINSALIAEVERRRGDPKAERSAWQRVVDMGGKHVDRLDGQSAVWLAIAWRRLGRHAESERLTNQLVEEGYRGKELVLSGDTNATAIAAPIAN